MSDRSNSSYPTAAGRGWIPASRDIGLPGEASAPRGRKADSDPGLRRDDGGAGGPVLEEALKGRARDRRGAAERVGEREGDGPRTSLSSPAFPSTDSTPATGSDGGWTPARKVRFLHHLSDKGDVRAAAARVGMSRQSAYLLRRRDAAFAQGWAAALGLARRHVEEVLATRALDGVEEPVFYHGEQVAVRRRYDTRLLLAHLARLDRAVEGDLAERFDEVLAVISGAAPDELVPVPVTGASVLPPARAVYVERAGALLHDEAERAWAEALEEGEAGSEDEPEPYVWFWRGEAARDWDGWRRRAEGAVDAIVGEGVGAEEGPGEPPMEFKSLAGGPSAEGGGFFRSGPCKACQAERARELDAGCDVIVCEGRRGASPTPSVTASTSPFQRFTAGYSSLVPSLRTASSTLPEPMRAMPISFAAASERSITRLEWNGPRSLTRTMTESPLRGLVTRSMVPKGSEGWAAVRSSGLKRSPLAVRLPRSSRP